MLVKNCEISRQYLIDEVCIIVALLGILKSTKLPLFEQSYDSLLNSPSVQIENNFSSSASKELQNMSYSTINKIFSKYLNTNFGNYITAYTDGLTSPLLTGYSFYIPKLHISFTNNLALHLLPSPQSVMPS
jgi:hypothetical protein